MIKTEEIKALKNKVAGLEKKLGILTRDRDYISAEHLRLHRMNVDKRWFGVIG